MARQLSSHDTHLKGNIATMYTKDLTITKYLSSFRTNDVINVKSSLEEESTYRQLFARQPEDVDPSQLTLLRQPYLNLINVYENEDIWRNKNRYINNETGSDNDRNGTFVMPLPEEKRLGHGDPAICLGGNESFQKNWNLFTESSLIGLDWSNVFAAGGSVLNCLLPIPEKHNSSARKIREWYHNIAYQNSDIDLFIWGLDEEAAKQKMMEIYETVCNAVSWEVACFRSKHAVTIVSQYPNRHIQIVLRLYKSPSEILTGFDVDCCGVGFDGKNVWALPRAHQAIIKQCNMVDLTRRSPSYEMRLAKYTERGFEIEVPSLERSRIDPTIYERSFEKLRGLARLLVLERLNTPLNRFEYVEKKRERNFRPKHPNSGLYSSRQWERKDNLKGSKFENSDYETVTLPYGPKYNAKRIMKKIYTKDMVLNSKWYKNNKDRVLHRHPCFFGTDIELIFNDCCGYCPAPSTPEEIATQIEEDKIFIRGKIEFIKDDPGRQTVGSFNPLTDDDWTAQAYITNVGEDLCSACARGAVNVVENLLKQTLSTTNESSQAEKVDVNARNYLGRTPLQLAVLGNHIEIVKLLLQYDAKIIARMLDGKTVVHLASQYGFLDILELLLQKSDENKKKAQEQEREKLLLEASDLTQTSSIDQQDTDMLIDSSFELVDKMEIDQEPPTLSNLNQDQVLDLEEEKDQDDIIDLDVESWDYSLAPLDYAILFGQVEIVKRLIKAGANIRRPIKLASQQRYISSLQRYIRNRVYFPLGLCMLTQNQKVGLEIATILLENGAIASQPDYEFNSILHLAVKAGEIQFVKLLLDVDPKSLRIINLVNSSFESPLYLAVANNHLEIAKLLMKYGARAYITLEDIQQQIKRQKSDHLGYSEENLFKGTKQPISCALQNGLYRILIEAGADVNSNYVKGFYQKHDTIRDYVENLIKDNESNIEKYKEELARLEGGKPKASEKQVIQHLNELLEKEKSVEKDSYRLQVLNCFTATDFYDSLYFKNPELYPRRHDMYSLRKYNEESEPVEKLKEKYEKLVEVETKKLNYNKECLEYLINHGAKTSKEINLEQNTEVPKSLAEEYQERIKSMEDQAKELKSQLKNLSRNTSVKIDFDEFIMEFTYCDDRSYIKNRSKKLVPEYVKLFQAVCINDISTVEEMSKYLVLAVRDKVNMTPFTLACLRGHGDLAIKILDIVASQYVPEEATNSENTNVINNYDIVEDEYDSENDENADDDLGYRYKEPSQLTNENDDNAVDDLDHQPSKSTSMDIPPKSKCSAFEFLMCSSRYVNIQKDYCLDGFEVAVLNNDLKTVKKILDWVEKHQCVEDKVQIPEKTGGIVTRLIRGSSNFRNSMIDSIHFGYVDMMDMLIEYAAGGNNFSIFDIKDPEEENTAFKIPKYYQGLDVDGAKKKSWVIHHTPFFDNYVEPSYLFYAAYYGNITSMQYLLSERPIKALERYARKYINNGSEDLRVTILNTAEDIQKVGGKLFTYELFRRETPFHWAVQGNKHDAIKELARLYKEKESEGQAEDGEEQLTLEEILDMRTDEGKTTALLLAAHFDYGDCIRALLEAGADPGITDCNGWSLAHYAVNNYSKKTIRLLPKLLQPETYQRMLEQRSKLFNHTPISMSIINSGKLTRKLLQQVTTANLFTYDFENNRYLHLALREGLWYISKKLIEMESSAIDETEKNNGFLHHENSFGQTPTEIAIQMFLNQLVSSPLFEKPSELPPELDFNREKVEQVKEVNEAVERNVIKAFNLMVPFYLPGNQGNLSSKRVWIELGEVNNMVHKLTEQVSQTSDGLGNKVIQKVTYKPTNLKIALICDPSITCKISLTK